MRTIEFMNAVHTHTQLLENSLRELRYDMTAKSATTTHLDDRNDKVSEAIILSRFKDACCRSRKNIRRLYVCTYMCVWVRVFSSRETSSRKPKTTLRPRRHFVPVTSSPTTLRPGHFVPAISSRPLRPGHFVPVTSSRRHFVPGPGTK